MDNSLKKEKDIKFIIWQIVTFLAMTISAIPMTEKMYNLLPFYVVTGVDLDVLLSAFFRIVMPFVMGLIYYGLYNIFVGYIANSLNARMMLYGKRITKDGVKAMFCLIFILLPLYVCLVDSIFLFFPYLRVLLLTILKEIGVIISLLFMIKRMSKGLDAMYKPVLICSMLWPAILMVVFV